MGSVLGEIGAIRGSHLLGGRKHHKIEHTNERRTVRHNVLALGCCFRANLGLIGGSLEQACEDEEWCEGVARFLK